MLKGATAEHASPRQPTPAVNADPPSPLEPRLRCVRVASRAHQRQSPRRPTMMMQVFRDGPPRLSHQHPTSLATAAGRSEMPSAPLVHCATDACLGKRQPANMAPLLRRCGTPSEDHALEASPATAVLKPRSASARSNRGLPRNVLECDQEKTRGTTRPPFAALLSARARAMRSE